MSARPLTIIACLVIGLAMSAATPSQAAGEPTRLVGWLSIVWGDPEPGSDEANEMRFVLRQDSGRTVDLEVPPELVRMLGGLQRINGRRVEASLAAGEVADGVPPVVQFLRLLDVPEGDRDVTGSQPWVSVLCKFSDKPSEPAALSYFTNMFGNSAPRLDHYWREVSFDNIDVVGSTAAGWFTLPHTQGYYIPTPGEGSDADLYSLFDDCTAVADPYVDFSNGGSGGFEGINLMFNDLLDCCAWGGGYYASLDGVTKTWRSTWEPPWGWQNVAVMCHEMGHGFGLPHSNNADNDGNPYDNPWDVMSDSWNYANWDSTYGTVGKHTISYHKQILGWVQPGQNLIASADGVWNITIDHLAMGATANYRMATLPISGGRYYTVEVRDTVGAYDGALPGNAVIIHEIDTGRSEPAWLVDISNPDDGADEGAMWRVGECFEDTPSQISVCVQSATANGFQVRITRGDVVDLFSDGFESGDTSAWSATVQ